MSKYYHLRVWIKGGDYHDVVVEDVSLKAFVDEVTKSFDGNKFVEIPCYFNTFDRQVQVLSYKLDDIDRYQSFEVRGV